MTISTTAELELTGAGGGEIIEVLIDFDIEPGTRGSWDEPPCGDEAINIAVTHWRTHPKFPWTPAEGVIRTLLESVISPSWLVEQVEGDWQEAAE